MAKKVERRTYTVELRQEGDGAPKLVGYAAVFDSPSADLGGFTEIIRKGAFKKTVKESDVRALWNHNDDYVLGRTKSGTLSLAEDDHGLRIEIEPPDTAWARDLLTSINRGDVDQMSFAFRTVSDKWMEETNDGERQVLRELLEVRLYDVSPVTYPAYEDTEISVRQLVEGRDLTDEEELALRSILGTGAELDVKPPPAGHLVAALRRRLDLAERI